MAVSKPLLASFTLDLCREVISKLRRGDNFPLGGPCMANLP